MQVKTMHDVFIKCIFNSTENLKESRLNESDRNKS